MMLVRSVEGGSTAPQCPAWCQAHLEPGADWDEHPAAITKLCRRVIEVAAGGDLVATVEIQRFATLVDGARVVELPTVDVTAEGPLTVPAALLLADVLTRAADITCEPRVVAV